MEEVQNVVIIQDHSGTMLIHLLPLGTLLTSILQDLIHSWTIYEDTIKLPTTASSLTHKRGQYISIVLGCWFTSGRFLKLYMSSNYRGAEHGHHYKRSDNPSYMAARTFQQ